MLTLLTVIACCHAVLCYPHHPGGVHTGGPLPGHMQGGPGAGHLPGGPGPGHLPGGPTSGYMPSGPLTGHMPGGPIPNMPIPGAPMPFGNKAFSGPNPWAESTGTAFPNADAYSNLPPHTAMTGPFPGAQPWPEASPAPHPEAFPWNPTWTSQAGPQPNAEPMPSAFSADSYSRKQTGPQAQPWADPMAAAFGGQESYMRMSQPGPQPLSQAWPDPISSAYPSQMMTQSGPQPWAEAFGSQAMWADPMATIYDHQPRGVQSGPQPGAQAWADPYSRASQPQSGPLPAPDPKSLAYPDAESFARGQPVPLANPFPDPDSFPRGPQPAPLAGPRATDSYSTADGHVRSPQSGPNPSDPSASQKSGYDSYTGRNSHGY